MTWLGFLRYVILTPPFTHLFCILALLAGATPRDPRRPAAYIASNKGLVLRVDCTTDQIICAYQLHPGSIRTLCIHSG